MLSSWIDDGVQHDNLVRPGRYGRLSSWNQEVLCCLNNLMVLERNPVRWTEILRMPGRMKRYCSVYLYGQIGM